MKKLFKIVALTILIIGTGSVLVYSMLVLPFFTFWSILLFSVVGWFLIELKTNWNDRTGIKKALLIGLFLMIFDFAYENFGFYLGLWRSFYSLFFVLHVPVEMLGVTFLGGTAWGLFLPKKFSKMYSAFDILLFSTVGACGEFLLLKANIMTYLGGWTSLYAFFSYMATWTILHILRYKILK